MMSELSWSAHSVSCLDAAQRRRHAPRPLVLAQYMPARPRSAASHTPVSVIALPPRAARRAPRAFPCRPRRRLSVGPPIPAACHADLSVYPRPTVRVPRLPGLRPPAAHPPHPTHPARAAPRSCNILRKTRNRPEQTRIMAGSDSSEKPRKRFDLRRGGDSDGQFFRQLGAPPAAVPPRDFRPLLRPTGPGPGPARHCGSRRRLGRRQPLGRISPAVRVSDPAIRVSDHAISVSDICVVVTVLVRGWSRTLSLSLVAHDPI
jgi:hypothetical protein